MTNNNRGKRSKEQYCFVYFHVKFRSEKSWMIRILRGAKLKVVCNMADDSERVAPRIFDAFSSGHYTASTVEVKWNEGKFIRFIVTEEDLWHKEFTFAFPCFFALSSNDVHSIETIVRSSCASMVYCTILFLNVAPIFFTRFSHIIQKGWQSYEPEVIGVEIERQDTIFSPLSWATAVTSSEHSMDTQNSIKNSHKMCNTYARRWLLKETNGD